MTKADYSQDEARLRRYLADAFSYLTFTVISLDPLNIEVAEEVDMNAVRGAVNRWYHSTYGVYPKWEK